MIAASISGPEQGGMPPAGTAGRHAPEDRLALLVGDWLEGSVRGVTGIVGSSTRTIEVVDRHGVARRALQAPLRFVIVCVDAQDQVTIRVLDADDQPLLETERTRDEW